MLHSLERGDKSGSSFVKALSYGPALEDIILLYQNHDAALSASVCLFERKEDGSLEVAQVADSIEMSNINSVTAYLYSEDEESAAKERCSPYLAYLHNK